MLYSRQFNFGVDYILEGIPESEWRKDLENIKKVGFNTIRTGVSAWPTCEPEPGRFNFELYDKLMDICEELGLNVILAVPQNLPSPRWLLEMYPDSWVVNHRGEKGRLRWPYACFNHPGVRERSALFIREYVTHFRDHPSLIMYQLDNEVCYSLEPRFEDKPSFYCYCQNCLKAFTNWLEKKYEDKLRPDDPRRFTCGVLSREFLPFSDIRPIPPPDPVFCPELLWIEWRKFQDYVITTKMRWLANEVKKYDKKHPVTSNLMIGTWPLLRNHDFFELSRQLDVVGTSSYTDVTKDHSIEDSMSLAIARSISRGKSWYVLERKGVPLKTLRHDIFDAAGIVKTGDNRRVITWSWMPVAYGAKGLIYWVWRLQRPNDYSFARPDGTLATEFLPAIEKLSVGFQKVYPYVADAKPLPSEVAILFSKTSVHLAQKSGDFNIPEVPQQSYVGAFATIWDNRVQADFVDEEEVRKGILGNYKVLLAPFLYVIDEGIADALRKFVSEGGHILWDAQSGSYNEELYYFKVPASGLDQVMHYQAHMPYAGEKPQLILSEDYGSLRKGTILYGYKWWEEIEVLPGGKPIASFADGNPAIVLSKYGKGTTMHIATDIFRAYLFDRSIETRKLVDNFLVEAGVRHPISITNLSAVENSKFEATFLESEDSTILFLLNSNSIEVRPKISLNLREKECELKELITGQKIISKIEDSKTTFEINIDPYDVKVILISSKLA
jgi:beta-galactosidase